MRKNNFIVIALFFIFSHLSLYGYSCITKSCDGTIIYSMQRYKNKSTLRLRQYRQTISAMERASKVLQKASVLKLKEYERLRERKKIELYKSIEIKSEIKKDI